MGKRQTRRRLLKTGGLAATAGLAGCGGFLGESETDGANEETTDEEPTDQSTESSPWRAWGFDNQAADEGLPDGFEDPHTAPDPITWRGNQGRVGTEEIVAGPAYEGANSYHVSESEKSNAFQIRPAEQPYDTPMTAPVSVALRRPKINNQSSNPVGSGRAALRLHEGPKKPCIAIAKRYDRLTVERYGMDDITVTEIGPDAWVYATVHDIDTEAGTFSLSWESTEDSGTESSLGMTNEMDAGYDQTVVVIDNEGYADALSIEK